MQPRGHIAGQAPEGLAGGGRAAKVRAQGLA